MAQEQQTSCCRGGGDSADAATSAHPAGACQLRGLRAAHLALAAAATAGWLGAYLSLQPLANWVTASLLRLDAATALGSAVAFFIYETPKVLLLLVGVVFVVGVVRTFFTPQRTRRLLIGRRQTTGNVLASLLGVATPFCSCSAVPLFIGFVTAGVPLGVTFSFLVAAPLVNEVALVLLFDLFGWKVAALYAGTGLLVAFFAGWVIGRLKLEEWVQPWVYSTPVGQSPDQSLTWRSRLGEGLLAVRQIVAKVWLFVVLGIAVGAGIHGYVPQSFMASIMGKEAWWAVPAAVVIGVPMYSNAAGIVPIVHALLGKGAAMGTVLAFMMSVIALSLPEAVILRKVLSIRLLLTFFAIVAVAIIGVGYLFNLLM